MKVNKRNKLIIAAMALLFIAGILFVSVGKGAFKKVDESNKAQEDTTVSDAKNTGIPGDRPQNENNKAPNIDYAVIAQKLNLSEESVKAAFTVESGQRLDFEKAATALGVSVEDLRTASGMPDKGNPPAGDQKPTDLDE